MCCRLFYFTLVCSILDKLDNETAQEIHKRNIFFFICRYPIQASLTRHAVLTMARRPEKELLIMPPLCDIIKSNRFAAYRQYIVLQTCRFGAAEVRRSKAVVFVAFEINIPIHLNNTDVFFGGRFNWNYISYANGNNFLSSLPSPRLKNMLLLKQS